MADPVKRTIEQLRAAGAPDFFERDPSVLKAQFKAKFEEAVPAARSIPRKPRCS